MSASAAPIPLDQFAQALLDLEIPQLHLEAARLQNSLYHLERSNTTLEEYPDDEDCKDAIRYNQGVIVQQQQRIELITLELGRRGVRMEHLGILNPQLPASLSVPSATSVSVSTATGDEHRAITGQPGNQVSPTNGAPNGHAGDDDEGVYL
ncbi:hypothetical protein TWF694_003847 [Orbilia ellipsospora]|uniref:Uncharacterized protein n=1 Tax=Orbilia ellipsospora TaxID=2528407 RepID=A0AAV9X0R3_9PEZI